MKGYPQTTQLFALDASELLAALTILLCKHQPFPWRLSMFLLKQGSLHSAERRPQRVLSYWNLFLELVPHGFVVFKGQLETIPLAQMHTTLFFWGDPNDTPIQRITHFPSLHGKVAPPPRTPLSACEDSPSRRSVPNCGCAVSQGLVKKSAGVVVGSRKAASIC